MKRLQSKGLRVAIAAFALAALSGCDAGGEVVGPRGGVVSSDDGRFTLSIPPGALDKDVQISVIAGDCEQDDAVGLCYAALPLGTTFSFPAEVSYEVADMELGKLTTEDLAVVVERGTHWSMLGDREVDVHDEVVYASATYLSLFALVPVQS